MDFVRLLYELDSSYRTLLNESLWFGPGNTKWGGEPNEFSNKETGISTRFNRLRTSLGSHLFLNPSRNSKMGRILQRFHNLVHYFFNAF